MFKRILIPLNAGPATTDALGVARSLAGRVNAELTTLPLPSEASIEEKEAILLAAALAEHADLIILPEEPSAGGNARRRLLAPARLLAESPAPLLLMPPPCPGAARVEPLSLMTSFVVAPLDESEEAEQALPYAIALAETYQRVLLLAHVVPTNSPSFASADEVAIAGEARTGLHYLRSVRLRLATESDVAVESMQLYGNVADALTQLMRTHESSLIVLAIHGEHAPERRPGEGVTSEFIQRGCYPLMVIPPALTRYPAPIRAGTRVTLPMTARK
jgi:nucleotide-binding universal stress UspA family protein